MDKTSKQYDIIIGQCRKIFLDKMKDYGSAWRILRTSSLTDQIYIKAQRIRSIESKGNSKVNEGITPEFMGIVNYSVMALIQMDLGPGEEVDMPEENAINLYLTYAEKSKSLMMDKNYDYDEAWRNMRISSLTDIILMKLMRIKQIEDNEGKTFVSEGIDANFFDIVNYSVFALIKLVERADKNFKNLSE